MLSWFIDCSEEDSINRFQEDTLITMFGQMIVFLLNRENVNVIQIAEYLTGNYLVI